MPVCEKSMPIALEEEEIGDGVEKSKTNGEVAGVLSDLALAALALAGERAGGSAPRPGTSA